jgi:hypothetical protein
VLVNDLAEIIDCGLIVMEALDWIADATIICAPMYIRVSIWRIGYFHITNRVERQVNITRTKTTRCGYLTGVCLVEYVEESGSKLEFLRLTEVEVLEE